MLGSPQSGGYGGCLRRPCGEWLENFYKYLDASAILYLELLALFHGLFFNFGSGLPDRRVPSELIGCFHFGKGCVVL